MVFKFVVLAAFVAVANAGIIGAPLGYAAAPASVAIATPVAKAVVAKTVDAEYDPHPQYSYAYDVQDGLTGDSKSQHETRDGDLVQGSYSLLEADGTRRTVDYTADPVNGFNAVVHKEPAQVAVKAVAAAPSVYAAPAVAAAPLVKAVAAAPAVYAAPTVAKLAAPISYSAPVAHYASAPVAHYASAPVAHYAAAPVAHYAAAPVAHYAAAPVAQYAASPVAHYAAGPVTHYAAAPVAHYAAAPAFAKIAAPLSYAAPVQYH